MKLTKSQLREVIRDVIKESTTYNSKADAMNAYFKDKITADQLKLIAKNQFGSAIATKNELSDFLTNSFLQNVMSDTYNIQKSVLIKKVKELIKTI